MSLLAVADVAVGAALLADAAVVLGHRPRHPVGLLLMVVAVTWFAGDLVPGLLLLHRGPMVHLHLSYPTGQLRRWTARVAVTGGYAWALVDQLLSAPALTTVVAAAVAVAAFDTFARTSGPARRAGLPALAAALLFAGALTLSATDQLLHRGGYEAIALTYDAVMILVATWLATDLLRGRWTEAILADLVAQLGTSDEPSLEASLRQAAGDPTLALVLGPAQAGHGRSSTQVLHGGRTVATLLHDPAVTRDAVLLAGVVEAARLAVVNARLREDVARQAVRLAEANRRLMHVSEEQRRLVAEAIADGPAREVEAAAAALRALPPSAPTADLLAGCTEVAAELDGFAHGLRAGWDGDLGGSLLRLAERAAVPVEVKGEIPALPPELSQAIWFLCSEALTNSVKHAGALRVAIRVAQTDSPVEVAVQDDGRGGADRTGSGLQGLAERIAAVGGEFHVRSAPGQGTIVSARVPHPTAEQP